MKINQTINDALISLGLIDPTENPTPEDTKFALRTLNRIMDGYNTQNLTIPYLHQIDYKDKTTWSSPTIEITNNDGSEISPFPEDENQVQYDKIISQPPSEVRQVYFRDNTIEPVDYICTPMTSREFSQRAYKGYKGIPTRYYIQRNTPTSMVISFNSIPQDGLRLMIQGKIPYKTDFEVTDDVLWGAGVEKMLMTRLAMELSSSYHIEPHATLVSEAAEAERSVKAYNYTPMTLKSDIGLLKNRGRGRYNPARI